MITWIPNLVERTQEQLNSKQQKIDFYGDKVAGNRWTNNCHGSFQGTENKFA